MRPPFPQAVDVQEFPWEIICSC